MTAAIAIRNAESKRLFDVKVDESGEILDYEVKTEKGKFKVSGQEVKKQIVENLKKKIK
jgi:hypothetical protein